MNILLVNRVNKVWFLEALAIAQNKNKDGDLFQASSGKTRIWHKISLGKVCSYLVK